MENLKRNIVYLLIICALFFQNSAFAQTVITKWQYGKRGAVSITYDGGSINQFRKALPIMNRLQFPATFFIVTGAIPGSQYQGKFIGRPVNTIIEESATIPTSKENFLERSSAAAFLGFSGTLEYHTEAGAKIETGKPEEAYKIMDNLYSKVRKGEFSPGNRMNQEVYVGMGVTWDQIREYAKQGHEFASHTITHPNMAALDDVNMLYELEKSRDDIKRELGVKYVFSAECPYATENERVMEVSLKIYPALRNRMPEVFLKELSRSSKKSPCSMEKEYVQWQRGATTKTPLKMMKSWVDTTASNENIWLVLAFHGVDGVGWESLSSDLLDEYFTYIKSKESDLWVATFEQATKYMRERMNSSLTTKWDKSKATIDLTGSLDTSVYNLPLTLKTYLPPKWKAVNFKQGEKECELSIQNDNNGHYVLYQVLPNGGKAILLRKNK